jgi:glycosyltransferase involved in cell wall biosynthesis
MKVVLCVHGYPPEMLGGTEISARNLAEGLAAEGHDVLVVAGSWQEPKPGEVAIRSETRDVAGAGTLRVERWTRPDLYFDHWHKSKSPRVGEAFRALLQREKPDLVHVLHWMRLTRDLVQIAAQEKTPALISLGDSWVSCPLTFRVKPDTEQGCNEPLSAMTCTRCAAQVPPRTPWVGMEGAFMEFANREQALAQELRLAGACLVPSDALREQQARGLGLEGALDAHVQAPCGVQDNLVAGEHTTSDASRPLRLGAWGQLSPLKGTDLLFQAIAMLEVPEFVHLELAGGEIRPGYVESLRNDYPSVSATYHGAYDVAQLAGHPVTAVRAMVSASRAPESFGVVLEESRALGLPSLLPDLGAFRERGGESRGALLFESGSAQSLGAAIQRLIDEEGLLAKLRNALSPAIRQEDVVRQHLVHYGRVIAGGPASTVQPHEWYTDRMALFAEEEWDRSLAAASHEDLGLNPPTS